MSENIVGEIEKVATNKWVLISIGALAIAGGYMWYSSQQASNAAAASSSSTAQNAADLSAITPTVIPSSSSAGTTSTTDTSGLDSSTLSALLGLQQDQATNTQQLDLAQIQANANVAIASQTTAQMSIQAGNLSTAGQVTEAYLAALGKVGTDQALIGNVTVGGIPISFAGDNVNYNYTKNGGSINNLNTLTSSGAFNALQGISPTPTPTPTPTPAPTPTPTVVTPQI
jgi:hypothetical protein